MIYIGRVEPTIAIPTAELEKAPVLEFRDSIVIVTSLYAKSMSARVLEASSVMASFMYDLVLSTFSMMIDIFFREIQVRGSWRVPRHGPIIIVAGPHANQVRAHILYPNLDLSRKSKG